MQEKEQQRKSLHNFTLENFKKINDEMIASNIDSYNSDYFGIDRVKPLRSYSLEDIERILKSDNILSQSTLSNDFFLLNGLYKQFISHYATLLKFDGLLIPTAAANKSLQDKAISKRYYGALDLVEKMKLKVLGTRIAYKVLLNGMYYGAVQTLRKDAFALMDLPFPYCRTRFKNEYEESIVEFDVRYFDTINEQENREAALKTYPKVISNYYRRYATYRVKTPWVFLPTDIGIAFNLFDSKPYFLSILPTLLQYDTAIENEQKREIEEIKKILIHKIPHLNDGTLLFEPDEGLVQHNGIVGMLKTGNPNISVLTTYGDAELVSTKTSDALANSTLKNMLQNVYSNSGISSEIFAASGSSALPYSLAFDTNLMMTLGNKLANFVTTIINRIYANGSINFKYTILPITEFNKKDFTDQSFKMASSGYSFLMPAIAQGLSQKDFIGVKALENDLLNLKEIMEPLQSGFTSNGTENKEEAGRPELDPEQKTTKTIQNIESQE